MSRARTRPCRRFGASPTDGGRDEHSKGQQQRGGWGRQRREITAALALELAQVRVNLIAAGFVDTPLSASLLGEGLEARREELRKTLPIGRVVGPADVAALAVHIMTNTALTGATYDIDGGQQFIW
jgi:enoyl-ACP reductase-like protein